ncbi:MAG: hypothetical protein U9Q05_02455, partial [Thermodesulfobacteriota bacterium]|nr:hypothetical protein [Thermodesulfobacteriota bacterium]
GSLMRVGHLPFMEKITGLLTAGNAVLSVLKNKYVHCSFQLFGYIKLNIYKDTNKFFVDSQFIVYYGVNYAGKKS